MFLLFTLLCIALVSFCACANLSESETIGGKRDSQEKDVPEYPVFDTSTCVVRVGPQVDDIINLKPLSAHNNNGMPRYNSTFNVSVPEMNEWNYAYDPCFPYNLPQDNPHAKDIFGDGCHNVVLCKYSYEGTRRYYYSLGINSGDNIQVQSWADKDGVISTYLVYTGIGSQRSFKTNLHLVCDVTIARGSPAQFIIKMDTGRKALYAELHHECCCVGACLMTDTGNTASVGADSELMLVIVGTVVGLIMMVALIGGLCYVKRTHIQFYSKLPGINPARHGQANTGQRAVIVRGTKASAGLGSGQGIKISEFRDYEPASSSNNRQKLLPVLNDNTILLSSVEMGQRLGGGIFADTHLAKWNEMTVTVKRFTLTIHQNQLTQQIMEWMKEESWLLSRLRHKNIVSVLGLCLDGRHPFLLTQYVIGECLKDFLKVNSNILTWPQRIRMCSQVADGMAFLHSNKQPIVHRDLRCGNLFLTDNNTVMVADFCLTKLIQPMRDRCDLDECSCQRQLSACPASVRWSAPELLSHPRAKEGESSIISTACDVFSFGMTMWEIVVCTDPFDEISSELEVIEIVKNGGRPEVPTSADMMPQYRDLMKNCWDQRPSFRPPFKQVAVQLKEMVNTARAYQKSFVNKKRPLRQSVNTEPA